MDWSNAMKVLIVLIGLLNFFELDGSVGLD